MSFRDHEVHLALESRFENLELVQLMLDESLQKAKCDEDTRYWVGIAVREAVANAIKHGNGQDPKKRVEVTLAIADQELVIRVVDEGEGFDLDQVPDPLAQENLLKPDGRGIFYMVKFMDDVEYDFLSTGGTEVTLRKRIISATGEKQEEAR